MIIPFLQKLICISLSALGFSLVFSVRYNKIFYTVCGGIITCCASFFISSFSENLFLKSMISAFIATAYSELMARLLKAPSTVFLLPSIIPLVPGSLLYYSMSCLVHQDTKGFYYYLGATIKTALGIAVGIIVISLCVYHFYKYKTIFKHRSNRV